jgi:hypothetical protein
MWGIVLLLVIAGYVAFAKFSNSRWIKSLVCCNCGHGLGDAYRTADQQANETQIELSRIACDSGHLITLPPRLVRFPCEKCNTIHRIVGQRQCVIDPLQEFAWPNPKVDAQAQSAQLQLNADFAGGPLSGTKPHWLLIIALVVVILGMLSPVNFVMDLQSFPKGTGIRPMGWPMIILLFGIGTPVVTIPIVCAAISMHRIGDASLQYKVFMRVAGLVVGLTTLLPLLVSTVVAHAVVMSQQLWLKP